MNPAATVDKKAVLEQLERILTSTDFDSTLRSREFLRHVVEAALSGLEEEVSQYAIAAAVFQRGADFDPATDPIVRMQAGRVRRSLEHYYLTEGLNDRVLILLPKGTYVPVFRLREASPEETCPASPKARSDRVSPGSWPTLLLTPFRNATGDPAVDYIAQGLASDLAVELSQYAELDVILSVSESDPRNRIVDADFEVTGSVTTDGAGMRISVQIVSSKRGQFIWGHTYSCDRAGPALGPFLDELARSLAAAIASENGMVAQHMAKDLGRLGKIEQRAYEATLRYHHFERSPSHDTYQRALNALEGVLNDNADCAPCCGYLARLLAYSYANGISHDDEVIQRAVQLAIRGVRSASGDQRTLATLSYVHLLNDQVEEARCEADEALALNPNSLLILDGLGYLLTLCGDWERGPSLSREAIRLNPFHLHVVHAGLWLDALRREDYAESRHQAANFRTSQQFWDPLMQAVSFACLGQSEQARLHAARLLQLRPDFPQRGHWLITRYVKFDDLVEQIQNGLRLAGITGA